MRVVCGIAYACLNPESGLGTMARLAADFSTLHKHWPSTAFSHLKNMWNRMSSGLGRDFCAAAAPIA